MNILAPFFEHNYNLRCLMICQLDISSISYQLGSALSKCKNSRLERFELIENTIEDEQAAVLVQSLKGMHQPIELGLFDNIILNGDNHKFCSAIADVLKDTGSPIQKLVVHDCPNGGLANNLFSNIGAPALSEVLSRPRFRLETRERDHDGVASLLTVTKAPTGLAIACNKPITELGWCIFLLCILNPDSKVESLQSSDCNINDEVTAFIVRFLADTPSLKSLSITEAQSLTLSGWEVFLNVMLKCPSRCPLERIHVDDQAAAKLEPILFRFLCDKSGIDSIFTSNHTLQGVDTGNWSDETHSFVSDIHWTQELLSLLKMNENADKAVAAREKILVFHFYTGAPSNIQVFNCLPTALLPHSLEWIGRGECRRGFSLLYTVVKEFPTKFAIRKRSDDDSQN
jgi:hypothetical protein